MTEPVHYHLQAIPHNEGHVWTACGLSKRGIKYESPILTTCKRCQRTRVWEEAMETHVYDKYDISGRCGSCDKFMKTSQCPKEKRGLSKPSGCQFPCDVYVPTQLYVNIKQPIESRFDILDIR